MRGTSNGEKDRGQSLSACYRSWKARGRPASRRTSSTVDVLALRHPLQWDGDDGGTMGKDETASKRSAEKIAHANARYTLNLLRAFGDLLPKLKRAYGEPAGDAAVTASVGGLVIRKSVLSRSVCGARIRACRLCGRWAVYSLRADRSARFFLKCPQRPSSMVYTVKVHLQRTLADLMFPPHCQSGEGEMNPLWFWEV